MNITGIKALDYLISTESNDTAVGNANTVTDKVTKSSSEPLRAITIDTANYQKNSGKKNDLLSNIEEADALGLSTKDQISMVTDAYYQANEKIQQAGDDPEDTDALTIVTVVDEIKLALAKGGVDTGAMQGLSEEEMAAMGVGITAAKQMYEEIPQTLSEEAKTYLIENELPPTVNNIYDASFKAPTVNGLSQDNNLLYEKASEIANSLGDQVTKLLTEAGYEETPDDGMELVTDLLVKRLPVTSNNIKYLDELNTFEKPSYDEFVSDISDIIAQGDDPKNAYIIPGYSYMDIARETYDEVMSMDSSKINEIAQRRALEETRLIMTVEANFTLIKKGISLDTRDLVDLVEKLKTLEDGYAKSLIGTDNSTEENLSLYKETFSVVDEIKASPADVLGSFSNFDAFKSSTLHDIQRASLPQRESYEKAMNTYEALWTAPRADMGDSIKKAFSNSVDSILQNMDMEITENNERAVRILSYNHLDVTKEALLNIKASDEMMQSAFKALTPKTVSTMIKEGFNPLDMRMEDLMEKAKEIKATLSSDGSDDTGDFAEFLWKAEQTKGITDEERQSFIGIYRLLHQVEKSDGAAVGAVLASGNEVTLRNLMTAVNSKKHSNRDYEVDVNTGLSELNVKDLPIIMQVQAAFETGRAKDALESMTPAKVMAMDDDPMDLSPDQFATAMENMDDTEDDVELSEAYKRQVVDNQVRAFSSDEEVYDFIARYELPTTANMLSAMSAYLNNRNDGMRKIFSSLADNAQDKTIEDIIADTIKEWGEAAQTPEDMARAQEALAKRAEDAMKSMIDSPNPSYLDIRAMKLVTTQFRSFSTMAKRDETYHVPILVADKLGNMSLKIVNSEDKVGRIDLSLSMENIGKVEGVIQYTNGAIDLRFTADNINTSDKIRRRQRELAEELSANLDPTTSELYQISKKIITRLGEYLK